MSFYCRISPFEDRMMEINQSEGCQPAAHHGAVQTVKNTRGFTLIELIMVCAIIGVLASLAFSGFSNIKNRARIPVAQSDIRNIEKDIFAYASEKGSYPASLAEINRQNELDPWGHPYVYVPAGNPNGDPVGNRIWVTPINSDFDLYSKGSDGDTAASLTDAVSEDDIVRGNDGSFDDMAIRFGI